jgi:hypothetical protein
MDSLLDQKAVAGTLENTMTHIDELLLNGDRESMQAAALHASACSECAEVLAGWNDLSGTARELHTTWNSDLLWPRIERAIRNERRAGASRWLQIAAAVVVIVGLGVTLAFAFRARNEQKAFDRAILREKAVHDVETAEEQHVAAINQLEKLAEPKLEEAASPLMVNYKEKLVLLDDAIAECQANIQHNRQNAHLRNQLLAIYGEKQSTLRDVLREESHASNQ